MLQNAEISPVTLLNNVSITDAHPAISKILGTRTRNICSGVSFSMVIDERIKQVKLFKRNAAFKMFFWKFSKTFKFRTPIENV